MRKPQTIPAATGTEGDCLLKLKWIARRRSAVLVFLLLLSLRCLPPQVARATITARKVSIPSGPFRYMGASKRMVQVIPVGVNYRICLARSAPGSLCLHMHMPAFAGGRGNNGA